MNVDFCVPQKCPILRGEKLMILESLARMFNNRSDSLAEIIVNL